MDVAKAISDAIGRGKGYIGCENSWWKIKTLSSDVSAWMRSIRGPSPKRELFIYGAGYEARTRDIQLGKLTLYQLS